MVHNSFVLLEREGAVYAVLHLSSTMCCKQHNVREGSLKPRFFVVDLSHNLGRFFSKAVRRNSRIKSLGLRPGGRQVGSVQLTKCRLKQS